MGWGGMGSEREQRRERRTGRPRYESTGAGELSKTIITTGWQAGEGRAYVAQLRQMPTVAPYGCRKATITIPHIRWFDGDGDEHWHPMRIHYVARL